MTWGILKERFGIIFHLGRSLHGLFYRRLHLDYLALYAKYVGTEPGNLEDQLPAGYSYPTTDYEFLTGRFTIGVLYSYTIGK